ncbi:hypothetical protein HN011_005407 [Eciton burchellii]|nr:hypothetical protein HN011_005407 [Eciton burchellii]
MGWVFACFRYCLVAGVILLGISGAVVSVFSSYFIYQLHEYLALTPDNVYGPPAILVAVGIVTCGIGWFAWQFMNFSNRGQVIIFTVTLATIVLIETGVGIWALVRHEQIDGLSSMRHEIINRALAEEKSVWDHMQSTLQCCGIDGPSDYRGQGIDAIPWSCCNANLMTDNRTEGSCTHIYKRGCQHVVANRTKTILLRVFLLALCSVLLQISFIACTTCYARIYKDRMDKRAQLEMRRVSIQDIRDLETKNNLLARRLSSHKANDS